MIPLTQDTLFLRQQTQILIDQSTVQNPRVMRSEAKNAFIKTIAEIHNKVRAKLRENDEIYSEEMEKINDWPTVENKRNEDADRFILSLLETSLETLKFPYESSLLFLSPTRSKKDKQIRLENTATILDLKKAIANTYAIPVESVKFHLAGQTEFLDSYEFMYKYRLHSYIRVII